MKTIEYVVDINGVSPLSEQFAGIQGDHKVTTIVVKIADCLYDRINEKLENERLMYRFDVCDGQGGIWQGEPQLLNKDTVTMEVEERHTRHGGKITVYLVISAISKDGETQMELYSFPMVLRFKNRIEGIYREGENYESVTGLAEAARASAESAATYAESAKNSAQDAYRVCTEAINSAEFVKNTDYATESIAGVVKINSSNTGLSMDSAGLLKIAYASPAAISAQSSVTAPIVPKYLDCAVKVGITTNTITLTDEEKQAAQSWLGITDLVGDIETLLGGI